jgi:hypothetical protein
MSFMPGYSPRRHFLKHCCYRSICQRDRRTESGTYAKLLSRHSTAPRTLYRQRELLNPLLYKPAAFTLETQTGYVKYPRHCLDSLQTFWGRIWWMWQALQWTNAILCKTGNCGLLRSVKVLSREIVLSF